MLEEPTVQNLGPEHLEPLRRPGALSRTAKVPSDLKSVEAVAA